MRKIVLFFFGMFLAISFTNQTLPQTANLMVFFTKSNSVHESIDSINIYGKNAQETIDRLIVDGKLIRIDAISTSNSLREITESYDVIYGFYKNNDYIKFSDVDWKANEEHIKIKKVGSSKTDHKIDINDAETNFYFKYTEGKFLKEYANGDEIVFECDLPNLYINKRLTRCFRDVEGYNLFPIDRVGVWFPVGLFTFDFISSDSAVFTSTPISIAIGSKFNFSANKNNYLGVSAYFSYSAAQSNNKIFVGSMSVGAFFDVLNLFYIGYGFNLRKEDNITKNGILIGLAPGFLELVKSGKYK